MSGSRNHRWVLMVAVGRFRRHLMDVFWAAKECEDEDDARELYVELWDFHREVADMLDVAARRLIELTPRDHRFEPYPLDGSGILRFSGGNERTRYDQDGVVGALASGIAAETQEKFGVYAVVNTEGENMMPKWKSIVTTIALRMAAATGATAPSFTGWRAGVAKELGVKLNYYANLEPAEVTVRIEGRDRPKSIEQTILEVSVPD